MVELKKSKKCFKSQASFRRYFSRVLKEATHREPLTGEVNDILRELLSYHPNPDKIKGEIKYLFVDKSEVCFHGNVPAIQYVDGSVDDFSVIKCMLNMGQRAHGVYDTSKRRFIKLKKKGFAWAKCSYCQCSLENKDIWWNPNPKAKKTNACNSCHKKI